MLSLVQGCFRPVLRQSAHPRTDFSKQCVQLLSRHPQIRQRKECRQSRGVLLESAIAHVHTPELALDHPERVFDLGSYAGLQAFKLIGQSAEHLRLAEYRAFARVHRDGPSNVLRGVGAFVGTLVGRTNRPQPCSPEVYAEHS